MNDWINTPTWNLQDALENVFFHGVIDPTVSNYGDFIKFATNYINGTALTDRAPKIFTIEQRDIIEKANAFLKNVRLSSGVDIDLCPIVWIKLGMHFLPLHSSRYDSLLNLIMEQKLDIKFHLKEFYVTRNHDASVITTKNISELMKNKEFLPLDAFLLAPINIVTINPTEWKIVLRKSISLKFEEIESSPLPKKDKRERLGKKYYDVTLKEIERLITERVSRKISTNKNSTGDKYTFDGSRKELLNILRKKNRDSFPKKWDYKAEDILSDVIHCRMK
jgi:hypothetical protein